MKVILLKSVPKLGAKDDIVEVNDGYAHNALFPKRLAVPATPAALKNLHDRQEGEVSEKRMRHELLEKALGELKEKQVIIHARANAQGHLFAKITKGDIVTLLLKEHRLAIDPANMDLAEPIKETGTFSIPVSFGNFKGFFTLTIVAL